MTLIRKRIREKTPARVPCHTKVASAQQAEIGSVGAESGWNNNFARSDISLVLVEGQSVLSCRRDRLHFIPSGIKVF
jgi:hypothetical protein